MKWLALTVLFFGLAVTLIATGGVTNSADDHPSGPRSDFPRLGPSPRMFPTKDLSYSCEGSAGFSMSVHGDQEYTGTIQDRTNGLAFNVRSTEFTRRRLFGDGHIVIGATGSFAFFLVDGKPYMTGCILRTHNYLCADKKSFLIDIQGANEEQIVFTDGTNRKFFTVYKREVADVSFYSDGVIDLSLGWTDASVMVDGKPYMTGCERGW